MKFFGLKALIFTAIFTFGLACASLSTDVQAQVSPIDSNQPVLLDQTSTFSSPATSSADATAEAQASAAANLQQRREERQESDLTGTTSQAKSRLARLLDENPIGEFSATNFVQHSIRRAVDQGVPANMLVLLLLFPVIASIIAASRHLIGLDGFGVYTPAVLSVALLSTGIGTGLLLFTSILVLVTIGRVLVKRLKLQYLPRTALLLWFVSLGVFGFLLAAPSLLLLGIDLASVTIFPILVLILLSENFTEVTFSSTQSRAIELTLETIALAVGSTLLIRTELVQNFVILHPEITLLFVFVINILVGRYTGLRVSEYFRFKSILDPEEE